LIVSLRSRLRLLRDLATTVPGLLAVSVFLAFAALVVLAILTLATKPETYLAVLTAVAGVILAANRPKTPGDE